MNLTRFFLTLLSVASANLLHKTTDFIHKVEDNANHKKYTNQKVRAKFRTLSRDLLNRGAINNYRKKLDEFWY